MNKLIYMMLLVPCAVWAEKISIEDFPKLGYPHKIKEINIGKGVKFYSKIHMTPRGNGELEIANMTLWIHDSYNNVSYYQNDLLNVDFIDLNKDGYKDIVISGIVLYSGEQAEIVLTRDPVTFVYMFLPNTKKFILTYRNAAFDLEQDNRGGPLGVLENIEKYLKEGKKEAIEKKLLPTIIPEFYDGEILIGKDVRFRTKVDSTDSEKPKMKIANLSLNIFDLDNNAVLYKNGMPDVDFIDIDKDGYKDIVISGIIYKVDNKNNSAVKREQVVYIYMFSSKDNKFYLGYKNTSLKIN